jgi:hypothetical protein
MRTVDEVNKKMGKNTVNFVRQRLPKKASGRHNPKEDAFSLLYYKMRRPMDNQSLAVSVSFYIIGLHTFSAPTG